ncbi:MAG: polyprenyl synthetase family protein [Thaumarchaeota archaeon]|nr:polyprenyl synthetase family protein [Nitrososphaerota archaeon]
MHVDQILTANKRAVDNYVFKALPPKHRTREINLLYGMLRDYPSRPSKGLRSSLCILTCQALGGSLQQVLPTAGALELFHNWILIHDDIEDASEMRRGKPVLHMKYNVPLAINTGDALHGRTWGVLLENEEILGSERTLRLAKEFLKMTNETTEGQHIELSWINQNRWDIKEQDYYLLCEKKTSWYTCIIPCRMGAIVADADEKTIEALVPFGLNLGIAFQITDDLLNLTADEKKYGKEGAGDISEGKRTLMLIKLLNSCTAEEKRRLLEILGKPREDKTSKDIQTVLNMMKKYAALDYAKKKASEFASKARKQYYSIFRKAPNKEAASKLSHLISFMIDRDW